MKDKINIICFCALLAAFCVLILLIPADKNIETLENRSINKAPALTLQSAMNGSFSKEFNDFISDQVGFRTDLILASKSIAGHYGVTLKDEPVIVIANNSQADRGTGAGYDDTDDWQDPVSAQQEDASGSGNSQQAGSNAVDGQQSGSDADGSDSAAGGANGSGSASSAGSSGNGAGEGAGNGSETGSGAGQGGALSGNGAASGTSQNETSTGQESGETGGADTGSAAGQGETATGGNSDVSAADKNGTPQTTVKVHESTGAENQDMPDKPNKRPTAEEAPPAEVEAVRVGPLLAFPDRLMEIFGYSESSCKRYAEMVSAYAAAFEGKARVFSLVTPTAIEFVDEKYKSVTDSEYTAIQTIYNHMENAYAVDAYSYLSSHKNEYIFFRTDHHWTALGAYYAYLAFCDAAGITPVTIDKYDSFEATGFLGYLYSFNPTQELKNNPDTIVYYKLKEPLEVSNPLLYTSGKATYSMFIGGDNPIYRINTSVGNGRTCVVLKDSFGNAFVPWIAPNYEHIIVIDPRHFEGTVTSTIAGYEDVDLIILNYAFAAGSGGMTGPLNKIR